MFLLVVALVTVSGTVVDSEGTGLPGTTVTISNGTYSRTAISDVEGRYAFPGVDDGVYDLRSELQGLEPAEQRVEVGQHDVVVPAQVLKFGVEQIVLGCGMRSCNDEPPDDAYDFPLCTDYTAHDHWLEALRNGDRSVIPLLRDRYAQTVSRIERHRLGAALMAEDAGIFAELMSAAETCTTFPRVDGEWSPAYLEWAAARELPADDHWWLSYDALGHVSSDSRSRAMLLPLLDSRDADLISMAIIGLSDQRATAALPSIGLALARFPDQASSMALSLFMMRSPAADELAMQYLDEDSRETYTKARADLAATLPP